MYVNLPTSHAANHGASPLSSSVPAAAPLFNITTVTATSSAVAWQPLPPCEQNGVITNYTIAYRMEGRMDMNFNDTVVDAANLTAVVTPLTPYTNYTLKMAASTSVGRGEFGQTMTVQTNESSKPLSIQWSQHFITILYGRLYKMIIMSLSMHMQTHALVIPRRDPVRQP